MLPSSAFFPRRFSREKTAVPLKRSLIDCFFPFQRNPPFSYRLFFFVFSEILLSPGALYIPALIFPFFVFRRRQSASFFRPLPVFSYVVLRNAE